MGGHTSSDCTAAEQRHSARATGFLTIWGHDDDLSDEDDDLSDENKDLRDDDDDLSDEEVLGLSK
jgi:hypothetical protein